MAGEYKNLNLKTLNQYFTIDFGAPKQDTAPAPAPSLVSDVIVTNQHGLGNTASALYQNILNLKSAGFYEQALASSLYVTQSKEVLELQYNYGSGIDLSKQKQPIVSPAQTSIPTKPMPSGRRGGYK